MYRTGGGAGARQAGAVGICIIGVAAAKGIGKA